MLDMNKKNTKVKKRKNTSICNNTIDDKKCNGKYYLRYDNNAPIFVCDSCNKEELTWKKFYNEYLQLYKIKENWNNDKDKISCIIGFFCFMYNEYYKTPYIFVPANINPYSSKECRDAWALLSAFNGNANDVRKYIYWLFKKGINKNTNITSFGYINTPNLIRKYNIQSYKKNILRRESLLPYELIAWCNLNAPEIIKNYSLETMNDLGAILNYYKTYGDSNKERLLIDKATDLNLIINGKLNIG